MKLLLLAIFLNVAYADKLGDLCQWLFNSDKLLRQAAKPYHLNYFIFDKENMTPVNPYTYVHRNPENHPPIYAIKQNIKIPEGKRDFETKMSLMNVMKKADLFAYNNDCYFDTDLGYALLNVKRNVVKFAQVANFMSTEDLQDYLLNVIATFKLIIEKRMTICGTIINWGVSVADITRPLILDWENFVEKDNKCFLNILDNKAEYELPKPQRTINTEEGEYIIAQAKLWWNFAEAISHMKKVVNEYGTVHENLDEDFEKRIFLFSNKLAVLESKIKIKGDHNIDWRGLTEAILAMSDNKVA